MALSFDTCGSELARFQYCQFGARIRADYAYSCLVVPSNNYGVRGALEITDKAGNIVVREQMR